MTGSKEEGRRGRGHEGERVGRVNKRGVGEGREQGR